jgi:hypothetical protein
MKATSWEIKSGLRSPMVEEELPSTTMTQEHVLSVVSRVTGPGMSFTHGFISDL